MAVTPAEEAKYALDYGVSRSDLSLGAQIEYDRLVAEGYGTTPQELTKEERKQARQKLNEEKRRRLEGVRKLAAETTWLPNLGVAVRDGNVFQHGTNPGESGFDARASSERSGRREMKLLGPLAGAHAEVVSGKTQQRRRSGGARAGDVIALAPILGPFALLAGASRAGTGVALVTFADGNVWEKRFIDKPSVTKAQAEAVRFNALASGSAERSARVGTGVSAELERLAALHSSGMLDDDEFRAVKARIISGASEHPQPSSPAGTCPGCGEPIQKTPGGRFPFVHTANGDFACPK
jgi:hypothetical protein